MTCSNLDNYRALVLYELYELFAMIDCMRSEVPAHQHCDGEKNCRVKTLVLRDGNENCRVKILIVMQPTDL